MKILMSKIKKCNYYMLLLYTILTLFFLPLKFQKYNEEILILSFIILNTILFLIKLYKNPYISLKSIIKGILFLIIITIFYFISIQNEQSIVYTVGIFIYVLIINFSTIDSPKMKNGKVLRIIFIYFLYILIILSILIQFKSTYGLYGDRATLSVIRDPNYSALVIYLLFLGSCKLDLKIIKYILIIIGLATKSRAFILMVIMYYIIDLFKEQIFKRISNLKFKNIFNMFMVLTIITILFNQIWISTSDNIVMAQYKDGIFDQSNFIRFNSNAFAINEIKSNSEFLLYGYDENIKENLGIASENIYEHNTYLGTRIVQPHNFILNIALRIGIILSIIYFIWISKILNRYLNSDNIAYILPYLVNGLILHLTFTSQYLIYWFIIIALPKRENKIEE